MTPDNPGNSFFRRRTPGKWARRAAIVLPFVVAARAILLIFQLRSEHDPKRHEHTALPWPPENGEVIKFDNANAALRDWAADAQHHPLSVAVLEKDFAPQPPETGCMLDPSAMTHGSGTLTLRSREASGYWRVDWSGSATMPRLGDLGTVVTADTTPAQKQLEQAMLTAADCGSLAKLEVGESVLHSLINLVNGEPPPPPDLTAPRRELHIRVEGPPP